MPSDKKISDLRNGVTLQAGDKILVARGQQNVYVTGSETPVLADFVPPTAKLFPHGAWGNGADGPLSVSDHPRGLIMADNAAGTSGFKFASRTIPEALQSQFVFTARISYNGLTKAGSGAGIGFATATTGPGGRAFYMTRNYGYCGNNMGPHAAYWNPTGGSPISDINGRNYPNGWEFNWFRGVVIGNIAQLYYSDDGVNFTQIGQIDFGSPVTSYGLVMERTTNGSNAALCDYFDSTELQNSPNLRQTGTITPPTLLTGVHAPHQYWRLNVSENWGGPKLGLTGLQLRSALGDTNQSTNSAFAIGSDGNVGDAFNQGLFYVYEGWYGSGPTGYIGYKFPYPTTIGEIAYRANQNGRDGAAGPKNLTIEYSDDGVTWTIARTINNLPIGGNALTTLVVDPDLAAVSAVNTKAKSGGVLKTGVKAAYSTRRLYDDYNGPLFAIEGAGGSYDVFAGTNGEADTTLITRVGGGGGDVSVTKWYDQSGNNHHAIPMPQGLPSRFAGYRPLVATAGQIVRSGPSLGIKFAGSPMDILDLNFLSSASYVIAGAQLNRYGGTNVAQIVSGLTTLNDSVAVAVITDGRISAVRNRDTRSDSVVYLAPRVFGYVVSKLAMTGNTVASAIALNGFAQATLPALTYADGDSNTGTRSRIGAPASAASADASIDTVDGTIREIFIYDTTVVLEDLYNSILGLTKAKPVNPIVYDTPTIEDPTKVAPKPPQIIETTPTQLGPVTAGEKKFVVAKKAYVGAGTATPKYNTFSFTIPDYNTITFEAKGGGGSSGESAWDGPLPNTDDPGLDGPNGGSTIFAAPGASYVLQPNLAIGHSAGAYHMVDPTVDFTVIGRGGFGGKGWYFNGGGYSKAGSNPGPASANGADGIGEFQHITPGTTVTGGGAAGGARTPYLGVYTSEMGGAGGKGGLATKTWNRSDVGAPKPGDVWTIVVGPGGVYGNAYGGAAPGVDGSATIRWS